MVSVRCWLLKQMGGRELNCIYFVLVPVPFMSMAFGPFFLFMWFLFTINLLISRGFLEALLDEYGFIIYKSRCSHYFERFQISKRCLST